MTNEAQNLDSGEPPHQSNDLQPTGLREAREATGLHVAALAAALKVPVKKLVDLEAGQYGELPDLTFARALAASVCRHLKIDAAPILERIPLAQVSSLVVSQPSVSTTFKPDQGQISLGFWDVLKKPAFLLTALVLLGALGVAYLPNWSEWPGKKWLDNGVRWTQDIMRSEPTGEVTAPSAAAEKPLDTQSEAAVNPLAASVHLGAHTANTGSANQAETSEPTLRLEAVADAWIEVVDGSGKVLSQRVFKKGEMREFSGTSSYSVVLGRSDAVTVTVRGQPFDVAPFARNSVARFQVK